MHSNANGWPRVRCLPHMPASVLFGGFERLCLQTSIELKKIGMDCEILDWGNPDDAFDILHMFSVSGNWFDIAYYGRRPYVLSAIAGAGHMSWQKRLIFSAAHKVGTYLKGGKTSYDRSLAVVMGAEKVICSTELERDHFAVKFRLPTQKLAVIPNGVPDHRFSATPDLFEQHYGRRDFILFAGNIVERKHPLLLARTLVRLGLPGVFIGAPMAFQADYCREFAEYVAKHPQLLWIEGLSYDDPMLDSAFAAAAVLCLPSENETQPLVALEAMATGTRLVLSDRPYATQEPFTAAARCIPGDDTSLEKALRKAMEAPATPLPDQYRWNRVAEEIATIHRAAV